MLPRVILYNAVSLDGFNQGFEIDIGKYYELAGHWQEDATLAGSNTMLAAETEAPEETEETRAPPQKDPADERPLLVIPDSRGRIRIWHYLRRTPYWRDVVALCSRTTPQEYIDYLNSRQVDFIITGDERVDFRAALEELNGRYGIRMVRVDSGGTLNGVLLHAGLVDEISLLIHPGLVGGAGVSSFLNSPETSGAECFVPLKLIHQEQFKGDLVWLRYEVIR